MSLSDELKDLEELTSNAKQIQDDMLKEILINNANTEYLRQFLDGNYDKEIFKKKVPVVSYEDVRPYIERVANGEPSTIISGETITNFFLSSGTSGGKQKFFLANNKFFEKMSFIYALASATITKHIDKVEEGKVMTLLNTRPLSTTPSGLPIAPGITSFILSAYFKNRSQQLYTSPYQVILCADHKQSMYCHLLCSLLQRDKVVSMDAPFACVLVQAIKFLETYWKEMCINLRSGHVSEWIKYIQTVVTGQMSQYIPILDFYSNKLPLISSVYASSETMFGVNLDPFCKPQDVSYTFMPNMSYFEFLPVSERENDEIVDLVNVKLG